MKKVITLSENDLVEIVKKVLNEDSSVRLRRRYPYFRNMVNTALQNSHPCEFDSFDHYIEGIMYDLEIYFQRLVLQNMDDIPQEELKDYIKKMFYDDIEKFYNNVIENCD
jgi:hypothetical protein